MSRCSRYGAATRIAERPIGSSSSRPRKRRQSSPPRNRMPNAIATITTNAPKSGSSSSRRADGDHHREQRQEALDQRLLQRLLGMQERRLAHRVARGVQHDRELHELGRLQVDDGERQPAARAVDRLADAGDEHEREQHDAADEEPRREALPRLHRHLEGDERRERRRRRRTSRAARGSTTSGSRCAPTPRPSRSTPSTPSPARSRAAGAPPRRATRRR